MRGNMVVVAKENAGVGFEGFGADFQVFKSLCTILANRDIHIGLVVGMVPTIIKHCV